jgi:hypothetical protein
MDGEEASGFALWIHLALQKCLANDSPTLDVFGCPKHHFQCMQHRVFECDDDSVCRIETGKNTTADV